MIIVLVAAGLLGYMFSALSVVIIPVLIAALLAGLLFPLVKWLRSKHVPNGIASGLVLLGLIGFVGALLVLVERRIVRDFALLSDSVLIGVGRLLDWLETGPLRLSAASIDDWMIELGATIRNNRETILSGAVSFGSTAGMIATGLVILLFTLLFFLLDGERIWLFLVRLFPKDAWSAINGAGRYGWTALVQYARAQTLVAVIDAVGIGVGAALLGVPLALPIGIIVFLGSFIPIVGAVATGAVAVLVALVTNGPTNAVLMLAVVLIVQQLESNILQPLLMGKAVSLHPLAVFLAVAAGSVLFGITGALFAVPVAAFFNSFIRYIAGRRWETEEALAWQPYYYPWEVKRYARRHNLTREQVRTQFQRFRRNPAPELPNTAAKRRKK